MLTLEAPAKINLSLRILRRREDGFHEIETRMALLILADRITVGHPPDAAPGTVEFTCDDPTVPADETNLAVKAVRVLETYSGRLPPIRLHLAKQIPHGAGLGGGSSDAAAVLLGLNHLFSLGLSAAELDAAAASIGSDIPFFLHRSMCDCTGRGEKVTPLPDFAWKPRILLVKLPFGVATPWAYRRWHDSREIPGLPYSPQPTDGGPLVNHLERPVFEKYPVLGLLKACLLKCQGVSGALMSGSGSTVFATLTSDADSNLIIGEMQRETGVEMWWRETAIR